ncbi:MAG: type IX secretion system sortase PorU [Crocinitomicaceae bacterium]|nr:type IX secretion system sortase PorU [Crocinitomicaceae bacterium]
MFWIKIPLTILILAFSFLSFISNSQVNSIELSIPWMQPQTIVYEGVSLTVPNIKDQTLDSGKPIFYHTEKLKTSNSTLSLKSIVSSPALSEEIAYLSKMGIQVEESLTGEFKVTQAGIENYAVFYILPFIKENGIVRRISNLSFELKTTPSSIQVNKDFATSSVLKEGSGTWYKISVKQDGIHKIDKAFLEACGISTSGLNPSHINIYGNGDGKLPELNSIYRSDDLAKNAIYIEGDSDGTFDDSDYILFYGWGPHRWFANGTTFYNQERNVYSDVSVYFINVNSSDTPLRISNLSSVVTPETDTVTSYSYSDVHEVDQVSLVKGGQRWYGELFDTELERAFPFVVPNILSTTPANFKVSIGTNARSSAGTQQVYSVNGIQIDASVLPSVSADWARSEKSLNHSSPSSNLAFKVSITRNTPNVLTYLDRIVLNARRSLVFYNGQFNFSDLSSVGAGNIAEFKLSALPSNGFVWDLTDRHSPKRVLGAFNGSVFEFRLPTDTIRQFVASNNLNFYIPERIGVQGYQNLHEMPQAELVIVTHKSFLSHANRLADLHRSEGLTVNVATTEEIYNEFSSGMVDATAIRMFAKMFFDRGALNPTNRIEHLLLFGDGTYDPKNRVPNNNYFVPTYQMVESENHISALVTDDYFGLMSDSDAIAATDLVDIGVGRLLVSDATTGRQQVDKIEHYMKNGSTLFANSTNTSCGDVSSSVSTFGDWRLNYVQIADDEEGGYFINQDCEPQYKYVSANYPYMNCDKLYTDAYTQVTSAGGQRYPDVFDAITNRVNRGALVVNYVGHGGEVGLAEERVVTIPQIQTWTNIDRMNIFVSSTCEFTKYDDPTRVSAGEWVSLNPVGGSIALMTTTRSVFFGVNTITGKRFYETVFSRDANNSPLSFGEIIRLTKNASGSSDNKRSFTLIGDPALKIALPRMRIVTDSINGLDPQMEMDTLKALSKVTIKGHLEDFNGNTLSTFNGVLAPSIFDKHKTQNTLGQDPNSPVIPFEIQRNVVYKGKATVSNGAFEFSFIVPKDINLSFDFGKISYYADNGDIDASGSDTSFYIGGIDPNGITDAIGPEIDLYLNDQAFVSGGITDETPILMANLFDENGINTVGNGIGHDLMAIVDEKTSESIVLNDYYTADLDSYQSGKVSYTMPTLTPGKHTLTLKVWDVNNNSSEETIDFIVQEKQDVTLDHVLNYPNPFTTRTEFFFEHNQVCNELETQIQIFTVAGRLVKTINQSVTTQGFRTAGIPWDGKDDFGDQLAKGVYVYRLKVKTTDGQTAEKLEKLVLLR